MSKEKNSEAMGVADITAADAETEAKKPSKESLSLNLDLESNILDHIANSSAKFKNQQRDDPELSFDEKRVIASDLIHKSRGLFLSKFGEHLKIEHLSYFSDDKEDYEICFHVKRLKRYLNQTSRQIDVKNRRYQALKMLVEKEDYFSETEMMKRNPLLYDHLIGQYLTEEEKKKRDNIDTTNITLLNLLLETIDRDRQRDVKKAQEDEEDGVIEENDTDEDSDEEQEEPIAGTKNNSHWGEISEPDDPYVWKNTERPQPQVVTSVSLKEREVLRAEFVQHMYESFLEGKDVDFDYR